MPLQSEYSGTNTTFCLQRALRELGEALQDRLQRQRGARRAVCQRKWASDRYSRGPQLTAEYPTVHGPLKHLRRGRTRVRDGALLRRETEGSAIRRKMGTKWDSRAGPNAHQPTARRCDLPLHRRLREPSPCFQAPLCMLEGLLGPVH